MKKIKFTGTVETFYFVPNCEEETAILYLDVKQEQKLPDGKEELLEKPKRMRFMLSAHETRGLTAAKTIFKGDTMSIFANEDSAGNLSYSIGLIKHNTAVIDATEYIKQMSD